MASLHPRTQAPGGCAREVLSAVSPSPLGASKDLSLNRSRSLDRPWALEELQSRCFQFTTLFGGREGALGFTDLFTNSVEG